MDHRIYEMRMLRRNVMELSFFTGEVKEYDLKRLLAYEEKLSNAMENAIVKVPVVSNDNKKLTFSVLYDGEQTDYVMGCDDLFKQGVLVEHRKIDNVKLEMAARLIAVREAMHMTQKELGAATGINQADISRIERGLGNPSVDTIVRLAAALNKKVKIDFIDDISEKAGDAYEGEASEFLPSYKCQGEYTYRDLMYIPMKYRVELFDGVITDIRQHDLFSRDTISVLYAMISEYIREHNNDARVFESGVGFRGNGEPDCKLFVIPDISVVFDRNRISEGASLIGGPDFAFDILDNDIQSRSDYYRRLGVRECWIMSPQSRLLTVYKLEDGYDKPQTFQGDAVVPVGVFDDGISINLKGLWRFLKD